MIPSTPSMHLLRRAPPPFVPSPLLCFTPSPVPPPKKTQRRHVLEWVRAMIAVALGVPLHSELPPIYIQEATEDAQRQISEWRAMGGPGLGSVREFTEAGRRGCTTSSTHMWSVEGGTHPLLPHFRCVSFYLGRMLKALSSRHFPPPASQLEGLDRDTWYIFEKVAITKVRGRGVPMEGGNWRGKYGGGKSCRLASDKVRCEEAYSRCVLVHTDNAPSPPPASSPRPGPVHRGRPHVPQQ